MYKWTVIKEKAQSLKSDQNMYVFKRDINNDSDGAHLTSLGIEFQTEEEAKENVRSTYSSTCSTMYIYM